VLFRLAPSKIGAALMAVTRVKPRRVIKRMLGMKENVLELMRMSRCDDAHVAEGHTEALNISSFY